MKSKIINEGYKEAIAALKRCVKSVGFYASGTPGEYDAVWARDSMIASLGGSLIGTTFKKPFHNSLELLSKHQSLLGQIPNAVGAWNKERHSNITFNTIDSTLWYVVGLHTYAAAYRQQSILKKHRENLERAITWLTFQDPNEVKLLAQQPTMDWQDAFPHKYGYTINTQALYYQTLKLLNKHKLAEHIKKVVNGNIEKYLALYDEQLGYYLPWAWKDHDGDREHEEWFDTLGNLLAIITDLATPEIAKNILRHIETAKINKPFPCKAIDPPIRAGDPEWHSYFSKCDAKLPFNYLNGGVWPFIGGFYVAALVKTKQFAKAEKTLEQLAQANKIGAEKAWEFHEWISRDAAPHGPALQSWSIGTYIFAYECVKRKKVPYFN